MNKSSACGTTLICRGAIILLKIYVKKGHNSKTTALRVMPLVLQLHLVMMSKYSKFGVDTLSTFWVMGYIKVFARRRLWQRRQRSSDHNIETDKLEMVSVTTHFLNTCISWYVTVYSKLAHFIRIRQTY